MYLEDKRNHWYRKLFHNVYEKKENFFFVTSRTIEVKVTLFIHKSLLVLTLPKWKLYIYIVHNKIFV